MQKIKIKNKIIKLISKSFQISISKININTCSADIRKWDSMGQIRLILLIEENFKIKILQEKYAKLTSVKLILDYLLKVK